MKTQTPFYYKKMSETLRRSFVDSKRVYRACEASQKPMMRCFCSPSYKALYRRIDRHSTDPLQYERVDANSESSDAYLDEIEYN